MMTLNEASAVTLVVTALAGDPAGVVDAEQLQEALEYLNGRAAKPLGFERVIYDGHALDAAALRLVQANEDAGR